MQFHGTDDQMAAFFASLASAQGAIRGAAKDSLNPFHKSSYSSLSSVHEALREPFLAHGLSHLQSLETRWLEGGEMVLRISTTLAHVQGGRVTTSLEIRPEGSKIKNSNGEVVGILPPTIQQFGSAATYGRRYSLMAITGIAPVDEDGQLAVAATQNNRRTTPNRHGAPGL